jgi:hypothetical protein
MDADFECLRSIEPLIEDADFFIGRAKPGRVNNALFGAVAGHPILERALDEIRPREVYGQYNKEATGPKFLDRILAGHEDEVLLLEPQILYARTPADLEKAYAVHHRARSWKDNEGLRRSLAKADQRLLHAQEEAREWRLKYQQSEAEAYGIDHEARTGEDADLLRIDMQRAEQKVESARQKAARWRTRCKQAETELDRLKRAWPYRLSRLGRRLSRSAKR